MGSGLHRGGFRYSHEACSPCAFDGARHAHVDDHRRCLDGEDAVFHGRVEDGDVGTMMIVWIDVTESSRLLSLAIHSEVAQQHVELMSEQIVRPRSEPVGTAPLVFSLSLSLSFTVGGLDLILLTGSLPLSSDNFHTNPLVLLP